MSENWPWIGFHILSIWKTYLATWRPSWTKISKWGYMHQWATIDNVHAWPCPGHFIKYWDLAAEGSILTKSKIGRTAAISDLTKILLDVHQGPIIGHDCAQYEWNPFIHVWERAMDRKSLTDGRTTDGRRMDGRRTDTLSMTIAHRWAKNSQYQINAHVRFAVCLQ